MHINLDVEGSALHTMTFSLFINEQLRAQLFFLFFLNSAAMKRID